MNKPVCFISFICLLCARVFAQNFSLEESNQQFRNEVVHYVRSVSQNTDPEDVEKLDNLDAKWNNFYQTTDWWIKITPYCQGRPIESAYEHGASLTHTLSLAVKTSLHTLSPKEREAQLPSCRFKINFAYYPNQSYAFIEYVTQGLELIGNLVAVRMLNAQMIEDQIKASKAYLLRNIDKKYYGIFKLYDASSDNKEQNLRTIYTASTLYTFLKLNAWKNDKTLQAYFKPMAQFILSNQATKGLVSGAFAYDFNPKTGQRSQEYVVGTCSKTIFTLLLLDAYYKTDPQYLQAAIRGGNWLVKMVQDNGQVFSAVYENQGQWRFNRQQSLLYSGQVLSALSRLYQKTQNPAYYQAASTIAKQFMQRVMREGPFLGDDFRSANSISTSWVMMSLIDFAHINPDPRYKDTIQKLGANLLSRQITAANDPYNNGRFLDAMTTSGNGWINEVFGNYYGFCQENHLDQCEAYKEAMLLSSRWLLQNAYTSENTFAVRNPSAAIGGFILSFTQAVVRTDAVCHGLNSLISLLHMMKANEKTWLTLPERPFRELIPSLRSGKGKID